MYFYTDQEMCYTNFTEKSVRNRFELLFYFWRYSYQYYAGESMYNWFQLLS